MLEPGDCARAEKQETNSPNRNTDIVFDIFIFIVSAMKNLWALRIQQQPGSHSISQAANHH